jgi:hypothetical protein
VKKIKNLKPCPSKAHSKHLKQPLYQRRLCWLKLRLIGGNEGGRLWEEIRIIQISEEFCLQSREKWLCLGNFIEHCIKPET